MNPRTAYEEADTATARAFVELFLRHDETFQFAIDGGVPDDTELRAWLSVSNHMDADGQSTIGITGINQAERFTELVDTVKTMGLTLVREERDLSREDDEIGEYRADTLLAYAEDDIEAKWNRPMLLVYGSLTPELKDACYAAFGQQFEYYNVRNHFVVAGEDISASHRDQLSDAVSRSSQFFEERKRDIQSDIRTGAIL